MVRVIVRIRVGIVSGWEDHSSMIFCTPVGGRITPAYLSGWEDNSSIPQWVGG